jgi:hypothetical protein
MQDKGELARATRAKRRHHVLKHLEVEGRDRHNSKIYV